MWGVPVPFPPPISIPFPNFPPAPHSCPFSLNLFLLLLTAYHFHLSSFSLLCFICLSSPSFFFNCPLQPVITPSYPISLSPSPLSSSLLQPLISLPSLSLLPHLCLVPHPPVFPTSLLLLSFLSLSSHIPQILPGLFLLSLPHYYSPPPLRPCGRSPGGWVRRALAGGVMDDH